MIRQRFQSFWHGPALTPYEQLALRSFLDHGHEVVLYVYERPRGVPEGVTIERAESILPRSAAYVLPGYDAQGGLVAFANEFRFELLAQRGGWWVDLDVVCLRSEIPAPELFFALEQKGGTPCEVNNAVLRFPPFHPLMRECAEESRRLSSAMRRRLRADRRGDFGLLGANVIARMTEKLGLCEAAAGPERCYPVHWREAVSLLRPETASQVRERTANAWMVHLWNSTLCALGVDKWKPPPTESFLRALFERHGVGFPRRAAWRRLLAAARQKLSRG